MSELMDGTSHTIQYYRDKKKRRFKEAGSDAFELERDLSLSVRVNFGEKFREE